LAGTLVRWWYLPFMLLGANAVAIWLASTDAPKWQFVVLLVVAVGVSFLAERTAPYDESWNGRQPDSRRDIAHALVNESLQACSLLALPVMVGAVGFDGVWPLQWPFVVQVLGAVVILDAGLTLGHWWSHRWVPLWRLHSAHHSITRFYGLNGLMKHPLHQLFETSLATAPLVVIGLPTDVATAVVCAVGIQLLVQHSNVDYRARTVRWLVAVNQVHRFHHLKWSGVGDVNFGLFFTVWDRLLGTAVWDPTKRFTSDVLGIAAEPDYPIGYTDQLARPFRQYTPVPAAAPPEWLS
jgi:sterol desaturase/sphingolipid hydroxylase (fatty acid hydroxylase superfamily)